MTDSKHITIPCPTTNRSHTPEYEAYQRAKSRCQNPNKDCYSNYGQRGVEFRFTSFEEFWACLGPRPTSVHSLDRADNDGHYEPGNVRWATKKEQQRNRRVSTRVVVQGVSRSLADWCDIYGIKLKPVQKRLARGWCPECALTQPMYSMCIHRKDGRRKAQYPPPPEL